MVKVPPLKVGFTLFRTSWPLVCVKGVAAATAVFGNGWYQITPHLMIIDYLQSSNSGMPHAR